MKLKCYIFILFVSINNLASAEIEKNNEPKLVQQSELPSLELLLYLGEFQDKDGSLLEPEKFDPSLKLNEPEQLKTKDVIQNESKLSKVKKEKEDE